MVFQMAIAKSDFWNLVLHTLANFMKSGSKSQVIVWQQYLREERIKDDCQKHPDDGKT